MDTGIWIKLCLQAVIFGQALGAHYDITNCRDNPFSLGATYSVTHSATCSFPCFRAHASVIWGTDTYTYDSSLCKSALHDYRISQWNTTQRSLNFVIQPRDPARYYGSFQHNVRSTDYGALSYATRGHYYFTSPRITDPVHDVTSVSRGFLTLNGESVVQECHLGSNARGRGVNFQYYLQYPVGDPPLRYPPQSPEGIRGGSGLNEWVTAKWPLDDTGTFVPGGLWCMLNQSTYSHVLSLSMNKYAHFHPDKWTVTASIGDKVELKMIRASRQGVPRWRKDVLDYRQFYPQTEEFRKDPFYSLIFNEAVPGNRGLYSLELNNFTLRGITRLIIRNCRKDLFGPSCEFTCPMCQNGGVCHDVMGNCICPPGFSGDLCETPCGDNSYGKECNMHCSDSNPRRETTCEGLLFCLPDPFGCTCGTGFKGTDCKIPCDPGEFGAGCSQRRQCHCAGEEASCNRFTGLCDDGCLPGWKAAYCHISYPFLSTQPALLRGGSSTLEIRFLPWDGTHGEGNPVAYIVELKRNDSETGMEIYQEMHRVNYTYQAQTFSFNVETLIPNTRYDIRVVLLDITGQAQRDLAPYVTFKTACGVPDGPPDHFQVDFSNPKAVHVSWKFPDRRKWNCDYLNVRVSFNSSTASNSTLISSSRENWDFLTLPFTNWSVAVRLETPNDKIGVWSQVIQGTSAEDAPDQVQNVELHFSPENRTITVTWEKPLTLNGILRHYELELYHLRWNHACDTPYSTSPVAIQVTTEEAVFSNVSFSSEYRVHVVGFTVKGGHLVFKDIKTSESVPSGSPLDPQASRIRTNQMMLEWSTPRCELTNGKVTSYTILRRGLDPWDPRSASSTAVLPSALISDLLPFTHYEFRVHACTTVGCGDVYAGINVTTLSAIPPAPRNLTIYRTTMSTLTFSWQDPFPPNGIITRYKIVSKIKNSGDSVQLLRERSVVVCKEPGRTDSLCYMLSGLQARKIYVIQVEAINVNGTGAPAHVEAETEESIPEAPERLNVTARTSNSLLLVWELPFRQNGNITGYKINVTRSDIHGGTETIVSRKLKEQFLQVDNLFPATFYNVSVSASTSKGFGPNAESSFSTRSAPLMIEDTPTIGTVLENTVSMVIKPVDLKNIPMSAYFILVKQVMDVDGVLQRKKRCSTELSSELRTKRCAETDTEDGDQVPPERLLVGYNASLEEKLDTYVAGKLLPEEVPHEGISFVIGDGLNYNGYYNAPLRTGNKYKFGLAVVSNFSEDPKSCVSFVDAIVTVRKEVEVPAAPNLALVVGLVVISLLAITAFLLFLYYKKPQLFHSIKDKANNSFHIMHNSKDVGPRNALTDSSYSLELYADCVPMNGVRSSRVLVSELENFVQSGMESGKLVEEFLTVSKGQLHSNDTARLPENKAKNRYGNLLPYDHSRVTLDKVDDDPFSDYINANFIDGYKMPLKYVATQGPKPATVVDFWRMIWQLNTCKIVMVTNVLENGKVKCEKYWPDTTDRYGHVTVQLVETNTFSDYVIRTLQVSKTGEPAREVSQFHFTTWADHTVPMYPMAMGGFLKRIRAYKAETTAPVVIHCSAGVGRTGTIILLDSMMDMALAEEAVDLLSHLWSMRQQRINQVENADQYIFAYQTLAEVLCGVETSILCSEFYTEFAKLKKEDAETGKSLIHKQFERLDKARQSLKASDCRSGLDTTNVDRNRDNAIVPPDRSRPVLPAYLPENTSNYINAVYVNGYKQRDAFVVTQVPLPHTTSDFWRMLKSTRTRTVVLLQGANVEQYWPSEETIEHGALKVTTTSVEKEGDMVVRIFTIKGPAPKEETTVKQFHFQGWPSNQEVPTSTDMFLDLIERVERWQKQTGNKPITVQCLNGANASGVFCATVFVCDKIKSEQEVDVYLAVRSIRNNRPHFITSETQYLFCHQMALTFLDSFETYANFQ